jgi:hypothetical protein
MTACRREVCKDGRTVDALAITADEGRGHAAKRPGEVLATGDPGDAEWGNPPDDWSGAPLQECGAGTGGTETSQYLQEKKATAIPSVAASERGTA